MTITDISSDVREQFRAHIVSILSDLVNADPKAMHDLVETRVSVNEKLLALDNHVVVLQDENNVPLLGIIGIINGFLGPDHKIAGNYDDDGKLVGFANSKYVAPYLEVDNG